MNSTMQAGTRMAHSTTSTHISPTNKNPTDQPPPISKLTIQKALKKSSSSLRHVLPLNKDKTKLYCGKMSNHPQKTKSAAQLIDARIKQLGDWRGETLAHIRALIKQADPEIVEEVKWIKPTNPLGVAAWSHNGLICTGEVYKTAVKMTFPNGAKLNDPEKLFNAGFESNSRRAMDIHEGDKINEEALKTLIHAAVNLNTKK
jgi:hypothetical protein